MAGFATADGVGIEEIAFIEPVVAGIELFAKAGKKIVVQTKIVGLTQSVYSSLTYQVSFGAMTRGGVGVG